MTLAALALLAGCAWILGAVSFRFIRVPDVLPFEQLALRLTAGLGLTSVVLGILLLANLFSYAPMVIAAAGNFAPTTDDDALAYVIPLAQRMADTGRFDTWPELARGMWPQHQGVLLAFMTRVAGAEHLGWLTGFELLLCVGVASALARRVCARPDHVGTAVVIALGAPAVAFLAVSAKEDLFMIRASALRSPSSRGRCSHPAAIA